MSIYGTDPTGMADRIASDALSDTSPRADIWGMPIEQDARSKGNSPEPNPETKTISNKGDSRATSKGNHGKD
jgi:hypothetical protein